MARFNPIEPTARLFQVSTRTIENWHEKGYIAAYRDGSGKLHYDADEIERALASRPRTEMRDGRKRGAKGRIVPMPVIDEVVPE